MTFPSKHFAIAPLADSFILANTPGFLFRRFSSEPSVRATSESNSASDLVSELETIRQASPRSFDELVRAYALLVAITLRPYAEAATALLELEVTWLEMGPALLEYWERVRRSSSLVTHQLAPQIGTALISTVPSSSTSITAPMTAKASFDKAPSQPSQIIIIPN